MPIRPASLLLLGATLEIFVPEGFCDSPSHSLRYYYLQVSQPNKRLPQFFIRGYLDDQPITHFDSFTERVEPLVPWMKKAKKETFLALGWVFSADLKTKLNHLSEELHTWQAILGCKLREDGSKGGFLNYGYDGMDFISFDKETLGWVAAQPQAQKVKETWEADSRRSQKNKAYLEGLCIQMMQKYLSYQQEALEYSEAPVGKVSRKEIDDNLEVLICQAFGFYPKEIQATWRRDGEVWKYKTLQRDVAPNSDGTYYVWLSIEINPKERDHFRCHLEHKDLQEPLILAFKEKPAAGWLIPVGIAILTILGTGILLIWWWKGRGNILYQSVRSSFHKVPSEVVSPPPPCDTEDEIQSEWMLQSKVTTEDKASYIGHPVLPSQTTSEVLRPTLRRREGKQWMQKRKQGMLKRSNSWAGNWDTLAKAGATASEERARFWIW